MSAFKLSLFVASAVLGASALLPAAKVPHEASAPRSAPVWRNTSWLNTEQPVTVASLKGKVVLVNFWVFTCVNCTRTLPALKEFNARYQPEGLQLVGIHTPEFGPSSGEHDKKNVAAANARYGVTWPVAQDNDEATWRLYGIRYWPSFVLIDKKGQIRYEGYGEFHPGDSHYKQWQARIEALLAEPA